MNIWRIGGITLAAAALLTACGGGDDGPPPNDVAYTKLVVFGDSLADAGSYRVGALAAVGGGQYTVNSPGVKIWADYLASAANVPANCAAQTGLNANPNGLPAVPIVDHADCFDYAQGGSRITSQPGVGQEIGQITDPIVNQIGRHLALSGGAFADTDLVAVFGGGNDFLFQFGVLQAAVGGGADPTVAGQAATAAMAQAGGELAAYVKAMIVAKGAKRVVVINLPDASKTPRFLVQPDSIRDLAEVMSYTFNLYLADGLKDVPGVLIVDTYNFLRNVSANPTAYGVTSMTDWACDLDHLPIPIGSSLVCSAATLKAGDVSMYFFADEVHPAPYGSELLGKFVTDALRAKGWL
jgi:phospholipase/lecithinase/hemolysin